MMQLPIPKEPTLHLKMLHFGPGYGRSHHSSPDGKLVYPVFWARNAIYHGLRAMEISADSKVLVPAYHCATAIEPVLQCGAEVIFYNIRRDCSPDFNEIRRRIDRKTRAILAIHYFGFPQSIRKFKELCDEYKIYLIEDCAHVLEGETDGQPLGSFGDVSVFSWRKFLPIYDGGHLVVNNPHIRVEIPWEKTGLLLNFKIAKNLLEKLVEDSDNSMAKCFTEYVNRVQSALRRHLPQGEPLRKALNLVHSSIDFDLSLVNQPIPPLSKWLIRHIDLRSVVSRRIANFRILLDKVKTLTGVEPLFQDVPPGFCPWVFPVFLPGRQDPHLLLREKGIPAVTWGGAIHGKLNVEEFPDADFLYRNLVFLPIHQSLHEAHLARMVEAMAEVLDS